MFLLDQDSDELVATVFDGITTNNKEVIVLPSQVATLNAALSLSPHELRTVYHGQCGCIACVRKTVYGTPDVTFP